jgi:TRAP-type C4-dicarboxylate transport system substrate-binding protein
VMSNTAWNKLSPEDRTKMLEAAAVMQTQVFASSPKLEADSIATMATRGLKVTKLDPAAAAEFSKAADSFLASLRGGMVPADIFDVARQERDAFRKANPK